jgi:predicted ribosomally synthesized peptide with nif11-like leader
MILPLPVINKCLTIKGGLEMSQQAAKDWMKKVFNEADIARKVEKLASEESMISFAETEGYNFSLQEWTELSEHVVEQSRICVEENDIELTDIPPSPCNGTFDWILGSAFGVVGGIVGAVAGAASGALAGAGIASIPSLGTAAVAGALIGGTAGATTGAIGGGSAGVSIGDTVGGWIDSAFGL